MSRPLESQEDSPRLRLGIGILEIPAFVDNRIVPAVALQTGEDARVIAELFLANVEAVSIPAVPPHGRRGRELLRRRGDHGEGGAQDDGIQAANQHELTLTISRLCAIERT